MTTQHIYKTSKTAREVFWSDGKVGRGPYYGMRKEFISKIRSSKKPYKYFSDYKDTCVLLIPKEFC